VNAVLLRPLPFRDPGRLVLIYATDAARGDRYDVTSFPAFADWRELNRSFESMAAFANRSLTVAGGGRTILSPGKRVSPGFFDVVGVQPSIGRAFRADEQQPGAAHVVILSDAFWRRHLAADAAAIGTTLRIDDEPYTIVGVMPSSFHLEGADLETFYLPLSIDTNRGHGFLRIVARLRPGVSVAAAQRDMDRMAAWQAQIYPRQHSGVGTHVLALADGLARDARFGLYTMLGVVALVLLIACANVAGLLLARGTSRQRELAVRAALGASRARLVRQLMTESVLLAGGGGLLGLVVAQWTTQLLGRPLAAQARTLRLDDVHIDASVLAFTVLVSLLTGVLFGALPAFAAASTDVNDALRDGGHSSTSMRAPRLQSALVVAETALALVLLAGAGTLLKAFVTLRTTPPGFEASQVLAVDLFLPQPRFAQRPARARFVQDALARVTALPGIRSAAFVADLPLGGGTDSQGFHIPGRPDPAPGKSFTSGFNIATAGYFALMRIPLRAGREFTEHDGADAPPVLVINETAARRFWPGESPLGKQIDLPIDRTSMRLTVVGVTGDVRHVGLGTPPRAEMFVNYLQAPLPWPWLVLAVRAPGDPALITDAVTASLRDADPDVPIQRASTLEEIVSRSILEPRLYTFLLGAFAALAVLLAGVGLYGLVSYTVAQRTHELGVRVALGASRPEIIRLVLGRGVWLIGIGAALGVAAALAATRVLVALVRTVEPNDPATFALVTTVLALAAVVASYLPARRAAGIDPLVALRTE